MMRNVVVGCATSAGARVRAKECVPLNGAGIIGLSPRTAVYTGLATGATVARAASAAPVWMEIIKIMR